MCTSQRVDTRKPCIYHTICSDRRVKTFNENCVTKLENMADQVRYAGQFKAILSDTPFGCMKDGDGGIRDDDEISDHEVSRICSSWKKLLKPEGECNDVRYARARTR